MRIFHGTFKFTWSDTNATAYRYVESLVVIAFVFFWKLSLPCYTFYDVLLDFCIYVHL